MKNVLDCIIRALLMLWELPQNIIGAFLFVFFGVFSDSVIFDEDDSLEMYSPMMRGAISLVVFQIYADKYLGNSAKYVELVRKHEEGHRRQRSEEPPGTRQVRHSPSIFGILMTKHKHNISL